MQPNATSNTQHAQAYQERHTPGVSKDQVVNQTTEDVESNHVSYAAVAATAVIEAVAASKFKTNAKEETDRRSF